MKMMSDKKEAKRKLYSLLLDIPNEDITENELEIMFRLAQDKEIQEILEGCHK